MASDAMRAYDRLARNHFNFERSRGHDFRIVDDTDRKLWPVPSVGWRQELTSREAQQLYRAEKAKADARADRPRSKSDLFDRAY